MLSTNQLCSPRNGIWTFHASWLETFRDFDTLWLFLVWLSLIVHLMESPFNSKGFPIWRYHLYHGLRHFEIVRRWHFAVVTHSTTWSFRVTLSCFRVFSGRTKLPLGHFRSYKVAWGKYMRWPGWFTLGLNYRLGGITVHQHKLIWSSGVQSFYLGVSTHEYAYIKFVKGNCPRKGPPNLLRQNWSS